MALGTIGALIAQNPGTALSIGSILAKLGQGYFAGKDQRSANQQNKDAIARANTISAFGGRAMPELVEPTAGRATTILGGLGTALGTASSLYGLHDAKKLRDLQMQNVQGQIDARELATKTAQDEANRSRLLRLGAGRYAQDVAGKVQGVQRLAPGGIGPSLGKMPTFGGPSISTPPVNLTEQMGYNRAASAAKDKFQAAQLDQAKINKLLAETGKLTAETTALDPTTLQYEDSITRATPLVKNMAKTRTPWSEVATSPSLSKIHPDALPQLRAAYDAEAYAVMEQGHKGVSDFLYGDIRQLASQNALLKKSSDLQFGANLLVTGHKQQNGTGDLQMVTASVRLGDPGMGVRPAEAAQWEESGGIVQGWLVFGERFTVGDRFRPEVRNKLLKAGLDQYTGSIDLVDRAVSNLQDTAAPRILQLTGSADINAVPGVNEFFGNYKLPPLEDYENLSPETLKLYRSLELASPDLSVTANVIDMDALNRDINRYNTTVDTTDPTKR